MMMLKKGVNPFALRPELLLALTIAADLWKHSIGGEMTITSLNDSTHMRTSLHYDGKAADIRTRGVPQAELVRFVQRLYGALGSNPDYDIIIEDDHIHIEYQPKYRSFI